MDICEALADTISQCGTPYCPLSLLPTLPTAHYPYSPLSLPPTIPTPHSPYRSLSLLPTIPTPHYCPLLLLPTLITPHSLYCPLLPTTGHSPYCTLPSPAALPTGPRWGPSQTCSLCSLRRRLVCLADSLLSSPQAGDGARAGAAVAPAGRSASKWV